MSEALRQVVWKCDRCGGDAQAIFGIFPSCKCGSTSFKAAQPPAPTAPTWTPNSPSDPNICNERSAQACGPVYCGNSGGYCNECPKRKAATTQAPPCKGMNCGCTDGVSHSLECHAEHAAAIAGGTFVQDVQPVQQPGAEPFAHICVLPTKDAGPTKFFTAPSDPRGFPVYLAAPAQRQPLSEAQIWEIGNTTLGQQGGWNVTFARAIEAAHGITAAPAAQKGEKL